MRPFVSWCTVFVFSLLLLHSHTLTTQHMHLFAHINALIHVCVPQQFAKISRLFILFFGPLIDASLMVPKCMQLYLLVQPPLPPRLTHVHILVASLVHIASQHAATEESATSPASHFPSKSIQLQISSFDWQKFAILIVLVLRETIRISANCRFSISIGTGSDCVASTCHSPPPCAGGLGLVEDYGRALIN